jgi:formamidopyrimidine-DNA glycosylase
MPELPEVEVTRRGIDEPLRGARVLSLQLGKPLRWPLGIEPQLLVGACLHQVSRRGKYLWLDLQQHGGLLLHLGMSGSLALLSSPGPAGVHDHFDLVTTHGTLRLNDPRRFGAVVWSASPHTEPAARLLAVLGPEPFDEALTADTFHAELHRRRAPIKTALLSGELVVGAGNIYACEALFEAAIHPRTRCNRISRARGARLLAAVRSTLARALDLGGSTLRDFTDVHGISGAYQSQARVYGRAGQPCQRCGGTVRRIVQGQRSTFYCPGCQKT